LPLNFYESESTVNEISKYDITSATASSNALLTYAAKPDASNVYVRHGFTLCLYFPFSDWNMGPKMLASKAGIFDLIFSHKIPTNSPRRLMQEHQPL